MQRNLAAVKWRSIVCKDWTALGCGFVSYDLVLYDMVEYSVVWYAMAWLSMIWWGTCSGLQYECAVAVKRLDHIGLGLLLIYMLRTSGWRC